MKCLCPLLSSALIRPEWPARDAYCPGPEAAGPLRRGCRLRDQHFYSIRQALESEEHLHYYGTSVGHHMSWIEYVGTDMLLLHVLKKEKRELL